MKTEKSEQFDPRADAIALENILHRYVITKNRVRYLRLRNVQISRDNRDGALIELTDILDAVWDAAGAKEKTSTPRHHHVIPNGTYFYNQAVGDPKE